MLFLSSSYISKLTNPTSEPGHSHPRRTRRVTKRGARARAATCSLATQKQRGALLLAGTRDVTETAAQAHCCCTPGNAGELATTSVRVARGWKVIFDSSTLYPSGWNLLLFTSTRTPWLAMSAAWPMVSRRIIVARRIISFANPTDDGAAGAATSGAATTGAATGA